MIRDIALFAHSVLHAGWSNSLGCYWDTAPQKELHTLANRLSNVEDEERTLIRCILRELNPSSILDVACGPATEKSGYEKYGLKLEYTGLDISEHMIDLAKQRHPNSRLLRAKAQNLPFYNKAFEVVLLKHILEHLPSYEEAIQEAVRVASNAVIIDFFHGLIPIGRDFHLKDRRGFHNNWYSRLKFHSFLSNQHITKYDIHKTTGSAGQTADIYVLHKREFVVF
jgi:ubiquinone/menaquinone biosynthesis C-methylase UbiE